MSKKNPLNFGMTGGMIPMSQRVQNAQNAPGGLAGNMNNMFMFGGGWAQQQVMQSLQQNQLAAAQNQQPMQSGGGIGPSGSDPNNSSGNNTYAINPNANQAFMGDEALNNVAGTNPYEEEEQAVNPMAGNFNPTTEQAAANIYGNGTTKLQPKRKLINL
jgi:hypothetical protein